MTQMDVDVTDENERGELRCEGRWFPQIFCTSSVTSASICAICGPDSYGATGTVYKAAWVSPAELAGSEQRLALLRVVVIEELEPRELHGLRMT